MPVPRPRLLTAAVVLVTSAVTLAQRPSEDPLWSRRPEGVGNYRIVRELSGRAEVSTFAVRPNPRDLRSACEARREAEEAALSAQEAHLAELEARPAAARDPMDYAWTHHALAQLRAYRGEMIAAVEHLEAAKRTLVGDPRLAAAVPDARLHLDSLIGMAHLRRGELENCLHHPNPSRCIFPIAPAGRHEFRSGSEAAIVALTRALEQAPDDLELRWLLNIAAMTLGDYPDGVPKPYLIPPERFASAEDPGQFIDEAPALGIAAPGRAGGAVVDDFTGDGRLDIVVSSVDPCAPLFFYVQQEDGRFVDRAEEAGLGEQLGGINVTQTDFDNDGRLDLFVMRGGWELPIRNSLLRNNGDGTFTDVTGRAGLVDVPHSTHSAAWADYDLDGDLDVYVGHEQTASRLFRNRGDGTFEEVSVQAGVAHRAFTKGVAWGDYDRDGDPDLYLSNYGDPNVLFRNNGDGTFTDVTAQAGVGRPIMSFPTWFFDYDNDGLLDLFVANFVPSVTEVAKGYLGLPRDAETMVLYRNRGDGTFEDVAEATGLDRVVLAMGANFGDIDNDGWLDIYLGTGAPSYAALTPNLLFRNREGTRFVDVSAASGTGHLQKGHGVAFADIDGDGDQDIFENIGGFVPGDTAARVLFRNPGHQARWTALKLEGTRTNRAAIGARIAVTVTDRTGARRTIHRVVTSGGSFGSSPLLQHIGLGMTDKIDRLEIYWPVSRTTQVFRDVPVERTIVVRELDERYELLPAAGSGQSAAGSRQRAAGSRQWAAKD